MTCLSLVSFFLAIRVHSFVGEANSGVFRVSEPSAPDLPEAIFFRRAGGCAFPAFPGLLEETSFSVDPRYGVEFPLHPLQTRSSRSGTRIRDAW
jgi:hypothetical protein